jgi:hypothetical protein
LLTSSPAAFAFAIRAAFSLLDGARSREQLTCRLGTLWFMAADGKAVEQAADELYGLPLDEFTRARDERAKGLRKKGDREAADAVKALRKPTVAAWALNQLSRTRRKDVEQLLAAGEELQAAQEELLAGGDRWAFQRAAAHEREMVAELAGDAEPGLAEKLAATLHAAALDPEVAEELRAGRLVREREAIGGFGAPAAAPAAEPAPRPQRKSKPRAPGHTAATPAKAKADETARAARTKAKADETGRRERVAAARTDERHARRELDAAAKALEHARTRAEAAEAHAAEANERARTTADRLKEARRAEAAARKAHERAARALGSAERGHRT